MFYKENILFLRSYTTDLWAKIPRFLYGDFKILRVYTVMLADYTLLKILPPPVVYIPNRVPFHRSWVPFLFTFLPMCGRSCHPWLNLDQPLHYRYATPNHAVSDLLSRTNTYAYMMLFALSHGLNVSIQVQGTFTRRATVSALVPSHATCDLVMQLLMRSLQSYQRWSLPVNSSTWYSHT